MQDLGRFTAMSDDAQSDDKDRAHAAWRQADMIRRLSDRIVGLGPIGIGMDGVLAWVPGANMLYSVGAGGLLLAHAVRAKASGATLTRMAAYLAADSASSGVPVIGWAIDTLFPGHLMAARALQKDIEARHGRPPNLARPGRRFPKARPAA